MATSTTKICVRISIRRRYKIFSKCQSFLYNKLIVCSILIKETYLLILHISVSTVAVPSKYQYNYFPTIFLASLKQSFNTCISNDGILKYVIVCCHKAFTIF